MTDTIKTDHTARIRLGHGDDCEGCQNLAVTKAAAIVRLAGWRVVRTSPSGIFPDPRDDVVEIIEELKP